MAGCKGPGGEGEREGGPTLQTLAASWPTPNARDFKGTDLKSRNGGASLSHFAETGVRSHLSRPDREIPPGGRESSSTDRTSPPLWGTPLATERASRPRDVDHGVQLANQVGSWATPAASDGNGGHMASDKSAERGWNRTLNRNLREMGLPQRLNPSFVDWLMGWPPGWTACAPLETGSFPSWLDTHSSCLRNALASR